MGQPLTPWEMSLRPWALSPESPPQAACTAQPHSAVGAGGQVMVTGCQPPGSSAELGSCSWLSWGSWPCWKGPGPQHQSQWDSPAQGSTAQGVDGVECEAQRYPEPLEGRAQWTVCHSSPLPQLEAIQLPWRFSYSQLSDFSFPELLSS